jgi:hypothetical protein
VTCRPRRPRLRPCNRCDIRRPRPMDRCTPELAPCTAAGWTRAATQRPSLARTARARRDSPRPTPALATARGGLPVRPSRGRTRARSRHHRCRCRSQTLLRRLCPKTSPPSPLSAGGEGEKRQCASGFRLPSPLAERGRG